MTIIVTDSAAQSRRHVDWGLEGPLTYNSATVLLLDSDSLVTTGFAGTQRTGEIAGAYDPNAAGTDTIGSVLYANQITALCGTGNQSHVGTFRIKARIWATIDTLVRLSWRAGDGPVSTNAWATVATNAQWVELDFGTITIPVVTSGTQRWTGTVEAQGAVDSAGVHIDYMTLIPTSDGYGKARGSYSYAPGPMVGYDGFIGTTAAAALNARVAPLGGTWATSGDATDFVFSDVWAPSDTTENITRTTNVAETSGRFAILGSTNYTDTQIDVRSRITNSLTPGTTSQGVIVRWTDSSNYLRLTIPSAGVGTNVKLEQVVAGVATTLAESTWQRVYQTAYRFRLTVFASGRAIGQVMSDAGAVLTELQASSSALATGGTLQTGKPGVRDQSLSISGASETRRFTEFAVRTPTTEPIVVYSGRTIQFRYDDVIRQDSTGAYTGRPPSYRGSRVLLQPGTSRVLVKARRNDVDNNIDDNVTDSTTVQVSWTPRYLAVPRS